MTETTPDEIIPDTIFCDLSAEIFSFPEQEPPFIEVVANGGIGTLNYLWSDGSTENLISSPTDGTYSVTVTDELGCTAEQSFNYIITVDDCSSFQVDIMYIDSIPALRAEPLSGTPPYLYIWSEGSTTDFIVITPPGTFSVTVEDVNGCVAEDEITL